MDILQTGYEMVADRKAIKRNLMNPIDRFGNGVTFDDETETSVLAHVTANLQAMRFRALQYAPYVTVLEPKILADMVKEDLKQATEKYEEELK